MGAIGPRGRAIFDPRGMIRRVYVKLQITMLHTNYRSFGSCSFREEDFSCISHYKTMDPRGTVGRIYKEDYLTLLHTKYGSSGPCGFKEDFLCLFYCKSMGANDPWGGAISDARGMLGRIYVKLHTTMLHTKYRSFGSCGFREEDCLMYFPF